MSIRRIMVGAAIAVALTTSTAPQAAPADTLQPCLPTQADGSLPGWEPNGLKFSPTVVGATATVDFISQHGNIDLYTATWNGVTTYTLDGGAPVNAGKATSITFTMPSHPVVFSVTFVETPTSYSPTCQSTLTGTVPVKATSAVCRGSKLGLIDGKATCLKVGTYCKAGHSAQYGRYGFKCKAKHDPGVTVNQHETDNFYNICLDGKHQTFSSNGVIYCYIVPPSIIRKLAGA